MEEYLYTGNPMQTAVSDDGRFEVSGTDEPGLAGWDVFRRIAPNQLIRVMSYAYAEGDTAQSVLDRYLAERKDRNGA